MASFGREASVRAGSARKQAREMGIIMCWVDYTNDNEPKPVLRCGDVPELMMGDNKSKVGEYDMSLS
jgi:hypothetical protein